MGRGPRGGGLPRAWLGVAWNTLPSLFFHTVPEADLTQATAERTRPIPMCAEAWQEAGDGRKPPQRSPFRRVLWPCLRVLLETSC